MPGRSLLIAAAIVFSLTGCTPTAPTGSDEQSRSGAPIDFAGWPSLTEEPVRLPDHVFRFCEMPTEARRLGPHYVPYARYYTSPQSLDSVRRGDVPMAVGTTIVKEKLWILKDGGEDFPRSYAAMIKREPGYAPDDGDWEYLYWHSTAESPESLKVDRGRIESCVECHRQARTTDYLFRTYLKK